MDARALNHNKTFRGLRFFSHMVSERRPGTIREYFRMNDIPCENFKSPLPAGTCGKPPADDRRGIAVSRMRRKKPTVPDQCTVCLGFEQDAPWLLLAPGGEGRLEPDFPRAGGPLAGRANGKINAVRDCFLSYTNVTAQKFSHWRFRPLLRGQSRCSHTYRMPQLATVQSRRDG